MHWTFGTVAGGPTHNLEQFNKGTIINLLAVYRYSNDSIILYLRFPADYKFIPYSLHLLSTSALISGVILITLNSPFIYNSSSIF